MKSSEIIKYLKSSSKISNKDIEEWLIDPVNEREVRGILGQIWSNSEITLKGIEPEFEQLLKRIHYRLDKTEEAEKKSKIRRLYQSFSRIAAILILPLAILSVYLFLNQPVAIKISDNVSVQRIQTKPGTITNLELPDGTKVWLNDGTILEYPEYFEDDKREVFVDGEAYFEVVSNEEQPFIVNNPLMNTLVTGTRFNLAAYSSDQFFEATLLEGKINLESGNRTIKMTPGQQVQYDLLKNTIVKKELNPGFANAWINGKLIIKNEKLESAKRKLSRWYNVDIVIKDPSVSNLELTCTLEDEKLEQCINLISLALPIQIKLKEENKNNNVKQTLYLMPK